MSDLPLIRNIETIAGIVVAASAFIYNVIINSGVTAKRQRQIDLAKSRLSLWEMRAKIEETVLSGQSLEEARFKIKDGMEEVWREANENLSVLASWNRKPVHIVGLPWWRRVLLAYKPVYGSKDYGTRVMYWLWLCCVVGFVFAIMWGVVIFFKESPPARASYLIWLAQPNGKQLAVQIMLDFLVFVFEACLFWWLGRREQPIERIKEVNRL